ncbi:hypothetical protein A2U01_0062483, partial [Trifolium medium]|nr:hypothetical protein [Trifolium medium]
SKLPPYTPFIEDDLLKKLTVPEEIVNSWAIDAITV